MSFKQSVLLSTMINAGNKIKKIPKSLFNDLTKYCTKLLKLREYKAMPAEPMINQESTKTTMVHLDAKMSMTIAKYIIVLVKD